VLTVEFSIHQNTEDAEWDLFLRRSPGGDHVQSGLWARVKASQGWRCLRITVNDEGALCGGVQILYRPLPLLGAVGYVQKGPILAREREHLAELLLGELLAAARSSGIRQIYLLPPRYGHWLDTALKGMGCEPDVLLARMRKTTRTYVRQALKRGITVREGREEDIGLFCGLLSSTAARQAFVPDPEDYFRDMWRIMQPEGQIRLLSAEYDGRPVSAAWLIAFGDTVVYKRGAWNGQHSDRRPNELMQWSAISWARENGFAFYDFDGIEPAGPASDEDDASSPSTRGFTAFKLGFGGDFECLPETYEISANPFVGAASYAIPRLHNLPIVRRIIKNPCSRRDERAEGPGEWCMGAEVPAESSQQSRIMAGFLGFDVSRSGGQAGSPRERGADGEDRPGCA
jgi:lipid II:glycine glycyltransferase (peptidoglycan interpeptide bridge formation enzyme)